MRLGIFTLMFTYAFRVALMIKINITKVSITVSTRRSHLLLISSLILSVAIDIWLFLFIREICLINTFQMKLAIFPFLYAALKLL